METTNDEISLHKCVHEPCQCLIPSQQEYCSTYCSTADDVEETEIECDCGHDSCSLT